MSWHSAAAFMVWIFLWTGISTAEPKVTITRSRGGSVIKTRTVTLNHLGQPESPTASGAVIPSATVDSTFRDDGLKTLRTGDH